MCRGRRSPHTDASQFSRRPISCLTTGLDLLKTNFEYAVAFDFNTLQCCVFGALQPMLLDRQLFFCTWKRKQFADHLRFVVGHLLRHGQRVGCAFWPLGCSARMIQTRGCAGPIRMAVSLETPPAILSGGVTERHVQEHLERQKTGQICEIGRRESSSLANLMRSPFGPHSGAHVRLARRHGFPYLSRSAAAGLYVVPSRSRPSGRALSHRE